MLCPSQLEVPTHGTVLQVDIGLVMTVFGGNAVEPFDLNIDSFIFLELIVLLQPARVLEQHIRLGGGRRELLMHTTKRQIRFDLIEWIHVRVPLHIGKGAATVASRQQQDE